jgi:hypothetical protein
VAVKENTNMNKDKLIQLARQAGFVVDEEAMKHQPNCIFHTLYSIDEPLNKFADLIVKECANIFDKDEIEESYTMKTIHKTIKEHFGVK